MMACQLLYFIVSLYRQNIFLPGVTSSVKAKVIDNSGTEKDFDLRFFFIRHIFTSTFKLAEKIRGQFSSEVPL